VKSLANKIAEGLAGQMIDRALAALRGCLIGFRRDRREPLFRIRQRLKM
jgi:hypothetical protein